MTGEESFRRFYTFLAIGKGSPDTKEFELEEFIKQNFSEKFKEININYWKEEF